MNTGFRLYPIQSQVFEGTPEMHVSGVEVVSMCLDAVVNGCASAALAAVGPMRFSLCRRVCLLLRWYCNSIVYSFSSIYIY